MSGNLVFECSDIENEATFILNFTSDFFRFLGMHLPCQSVARPLKTTSRKMEDLRYDACYSLRKHAINGHE